MKHLKRSTLVAVIYVKAECQIADNCPGVKPHENLPKFSIAPPTPL
jgi:hypothetical protein